MQTKLKTTTYQQEHQQEQHQTHISHTHTLTHIGRCSFYQVSIHEPVLAF